VAPNCGPQIFVGFFFSNGKKNIAEKKKLVIKKIKKTLNPKYKGQTED
jgi:hypothetical protein